MPGWKSLDDDLTENVNYANLQRLAGVDPNGLDGDLLEKKPPPPQEEIASPSGERDIDL